MEVKESESSVIAKPVPSRPLYSGLRTFTELLVDSVNVSSPKSYHEALAAPIRPKTVRFRPTVKNVAPSGSVCSRGEVPVRGNSKRPYDERGTLESRSYVIYKPKPKLVSKATISILANMQGRFCHQQPLKQKEAEVSNVSPDRWNFKNQFNPDLRMKVPSFGQTDTIISSDNPTGDRSSLDGYHWRKYGQKQVKGSEFPRGYFRCTYPNCPVKKKVERSLDGKISEIVYQGEHNHPRPCPLPRRSSSNVTQKPGFVSERSSGQDPVVYNCLRNQLSKQNDWPGSERGDANRKRVGVFPPFEFAAFGATTNSAAGTSDSCCRSGECDETSKGLELDGEVDEPTTKRRKTGNQPSEAGAPEEGSAEPRNSVDSEALDDGFRWRKYGQKVVRGNPFPRSYYRCTSPNCGARKHVERASDDPRAFITTYEGKHNHH